MLGLDLLALALGTVPQADEPDFARDVRPLLARRCFSCHGNDEEARGADLRLDLRDEATADRGGFPAIVPGDVEGSELWARVTDDIDPMPPEHIGDMLEADELDVLRRWIEAGAPYEDHWAFEAPVRPEVPGGAGGPGAIDAFVREALTARGLEPSPRADDATLLRRLSLDLTGLPPTADEARAFLASDDPAKVDAAIERLLASPAYAERWAAVWLDLARYADSAGHGSDPLRTIWRYRDWVIEAFEANMPFDEFTVQQLAGDLLPDAGMDERLATAFHRNTMTNTEGGTDDEEFRVLAVKDRVNTTMQVWMGLTAGCAECHSHKFDPISHHEYYELFDLFNQTADRDRNDEAPLLDTPTRAQQAEHARLEASIAEAEARLREHEEVLQSHPMGAQRLLTQAAEDLTRPNVGAASIEVDEGERAVRRREGGWLVASERETAVRRVVLPEGEHAPAFLRVDAFAGDSLPRGGPGRNSASGNFVLSGLRVRALPGPFAGPISARRVRVELPGEGRILSLAEVELIDGKGDVVRPAGAARQSSTAYGGPAELAYDGETSGTFEDGSVTHTATESSPWWEVQLEQDLDLAGVRLWTRTDGDLASRVHGVRVALLDAEGEELWRSAPAPSFAASTTIGPALGEPLRLEAVAATHEQRRFEARRAVDALLSTREGWAVGGGEGQDQAAVYLLPELAGPRALQVTLEHLWGSDHLLGSFALSGLVDGSREAPLLLSNAAQEGLMAPADQRTPAQKKAVRAALRSTDPELRTLQARVDELKTEARSLGVVRTPVMEELADDKRRATHVLVRGNFMQKADEVHAAVPAAFGALPDGAPKDRLALARWLVAPENPLTARVAVNRVWARLFGRGLVATEEDFGTQGALPSHPELLDWLATEFVAGDWDHKELLRLIVGSDTYRQSSSAPPERRALDPDAVWLSRYPRQRLDAEMVRDSSLRAAGLLSGKRFGPSVFPPQPEGMWQAAFNGQRNWMESEGEERYRRGLYVFMRRTIPYPMMATFDAPSREVCSIRRIHTNTPLQAFVTLNDPVFVEAAQALGREMYELDARVGGYDTVRELLWRVTSRPPDEEQVHILATLYGMARVDFEGDGADARAFAEDPLGPLPEGANAERAAAWTLTASAALNMDAALTKE